MYIYNVPYDIYIYIYIYIYIGYMIYIGSFCGKAKVTDVKFDHLPALVFKTGFTWLIYEYCDRNLI